MIITNVMTNLNLSKTGSFSIVFLSIWGLYLLSLCVNLPAMEILSSLLFLMALGLLLFYRALKPMVSTLLGDRKTRWISLCFGVYAISWIVAVLFNQAHVAQPLKDLEPLRRLLFVLFPSILIGLFAKQKKVLAKTLFFALIFGFLMSGPLGWWVREWERDGRYSGSLSVAFTFGSVISIHFFIVIWSWLELGKPYKKIFWILMLLWIVAIGLTQTRAVWIGLVLSVSVSLFLYLKNRRSRFIAFVIIGILCGIFYQVPLVKERLKRSFSDQSSNERMWVARSGIQMGIDYFPWGIGYKSPARLMDRYATQLGAPSGFFSHTHNQWIELFAATGVVSVICWGAIFVLLLRIVWQQVELQKRQGWVLFAGLLHLFFLSFFDVIIQDAEMAHTTFLFIGIIIAQKFR